MVRVVLEAGVDDAVVGGDETVFVATVKVHTVPKEMKLCSLPQYRYTIPRQLKLFSKRQYGFTLPIFIIGSVTSF